MTYKEIIALVAVLAIGILAGHFLWPRGDVVPLPPVMVLDSTAVAALKDSIDEIEGKLSWQTERDAGIIARERLGRRSAEMLYRRLLAQMAAQDSVDSAGVVLPGFDTSGTTYLSVAFDTTTHRIDTVAIALDSTGEKIERREIPRTIHFSGRYALPPFNVFRGIKVTVEPGMIYFAHPLLKEQLVVHDVPWGWVLPVGLGGLAIGLIIMALIHGG